MCKTERKFMTSENTRELQTIYNQTDLDNVGRLDGRPVFVTEGIAQAAAIVHCGGTACMFSQLDDVVLTQLENANAIYVSPTAARDAGYNGSAQEGFDDADHMTEEELRAELNRLTSHYETPYSLTDYLAEEFDADMHDWIYNSAPTGFIKLDKIIGRGLHTGFYLFLGGSSVGKTTFLWQMADNIASNGRDVLFFALEMDRREMAIKSISRRMRTSTDILEDPQRYKQLCPKIAETIKSMNGNRIQLIEVELGCTVSTIAAEVDRHVQRTGRTPIVIVDYLQILAADNPTGDTKHDTDEVIKALKSISRKHKLTVVSISSVNRASYNSSLTLGSAKESGMAEYSADVVIALELTAIGDIQSMTRIYQNVYDRNGNAVKDDKGKPRTVLESETALNERKRKAIIEASAEIPRKITLSGLKNRHGIQRFEVYTEFNPCINEYKEVDKKDIWGDVET